MTQLSLVEHLPDTKANDSVVKVLEEILELARTGEIVGATVVGYYKDRGTRNWLVPGTNPTLMLGAVNAASYRLAKFIDERP